METREEMAMPRRGEIKGDLKKGKQVPQELSPGKRRQQVQEQRPTPLSFSLHRSPFLDWTFSPRQIANSYLKPQFMFYKTFPNPSTHKKNRTILWPRKVFHFTHPTIMLMLFCNISQSGFVTSCNYCTLIGLFTYFYLEFLNMMWTFLKVKSIIILAVFFSKAVNCIARCSIYASWLRKTNKEGRRRRGNVTTKMCRRNMSWWRRKENFMQARNKQHPGDTLKCLLNWRKDTRKGRMRRRKERKDYQKWKREGWREKGMGGQKNGREDGKKKWEKR